MARRVNTNFLIILTVLVVGLLSNRVALAVIVVAVGSAFTALMRLLGAYERLGKDDVQG